MEHEKEAAENSLNVGTDARAELASKGNGSEVLAEQSSSRMSEIELLKWEIVLLRREKELIGREKELQASNSPSVSDEVVDDRSSTAAQELQPAFRMGCNEINIIIPEFDPARDDVFLDDWLRNIENLKDIYGWDDRTLLFYGILRLGGAAKLWYQSKKSDIKLWTVFKEELLRSFPRNKDDSAIIMQIMARRKGSDEFIETYIYSVASLAAKINLTEVTTIKYIISGLDDQNLKNVLMASNCGSINGLLNKIKSYEEIYQQNSHRSELEANTSRRLEVTGRFRTYQEGRPRKGTYPHRQTYHANKFQSGNLIMKRSRGDEAGNSKHADKRPRLVQTEISQICFRCNKEGHIAAFCPSNPKVRTCYKCKKPGHIAKDCQSVGYISNGESLESEYYKKIKILNKELVAYLDLGSECSTIKDENTKDCKLKVIPSDRILRGFGGAETKVLGVAKETVRLDNITRQIELAVVPNYSQTVPVIIGRNFMDHPDIKIIKTWRKFELVEIGGSEQSKNKSSSEHHEVLKIAVNEGKPEFCLEDINVDGEVMEKDKLTLLELVNKYKYCFSRNMSELGKTDLIKMDIVLKENKIVNYRPYRVPYAQKPILREIIQELLRQDIIQPSSSEYASPVLLVKNKSGDYRICVTTGN